MSSSLLRSVEELTDIFGMRVLVRTSLDVPMDHGVPSDHFRVRRSVATIAYLLEKGARVIILTHVGRDPKNSTLPLIPILQKHFPVRHVNGVVGDFVYGEIAHMKEGTAVLLENVRSYTEEEENDIGFAKTLASYADFYVNDAFAVSHRAHASIVGIPKFIPSFAGITFMEEYTELSKAFTPDTPSLFILGGAKFETKEPLIEKYSNHYSHVFIGGALANDFLKGKGFEVGESLLSSVDLKGNPLLEKENILIPTDVMVGGTEGIHEVMVGGVKSDEKILDVGPRTTEELAPYIANAKTILWNGPLGNYETGFDAATKECARHIAESKAFSIVGGGDTITAIESLGLENSFNFLSTAGGAMLEFLEKHTMPGIDALQKPRT
ncbi:MAG: phosphoglycerate kinase [Minisyncoccia bacterium]